MRLSRDFDFEESLESLPILPALEVVLVLDLRALGLLDSVDSIEIACMDFSSVASASFVSLSLDDLGDFVA